MKNKNEKLWGSATLDHHRPTVVVSIPIARLTAVTATTTAAILHGVWNGGCVETADGWLCASCRSLSQLLVVHQLL
jgi:hypothetical protein